MTSLPAIVTIHCVQKVFTRNFDVRKLVLIGLHFGRNITEKASEQKCFIFHLT